MKGTDIKNKANIGSSSLILIFIVMCLGTFGLLSLSSANNDWDLAKRNAQAVLHYYEADSRGEEFLQMVDQAVKKTGADLTDMDERRSGLKAELGDYYQEETGMVVTEIPMEYGQALHIELALICGEGKSYEILTWRVINLEDYEIDRSMPVWDGK